MVGVPGVPRLSFCDLLSMFARPKAAASGTTKGSSSAPSKTATARHTATTARRGTTTSTSASSPAGKPPVSRIRAPTASSLARTKSMEAQSARKRSTPVKSAGKAEQTEAEAEWAAAEDAHADLARAELLRIRAREEHQRIKDAAERDVRLENFYKMKETK